MAKSRMRGDRGFSRLIRQVPAAARAGITDLLNDYGTKVLAAQKADAAKKTGALAAGLSMSKVTKALRLRVGLIGTPRGRAKLFYGWIVERGRKAQTVNVTRKRGVAPYKLKVKAMPARHFVYSKRPELRSDFQRRLGLYWEDVLATAAQGVGND